MVVTLFPQHTSTVLTARQCATAHSFGTTGSYCQNYSVFWRIAIIRMLNVHIQSKKRPTCIKYASSLIAVRVKIIIVVTISRIALGLGCAGIRVRMPPSGHPTLLEFNPSMTGCIDCGQYYPCLSVDCPFNSRPGAVHRAAVLKHSCAHARQA